MAVKIKINLFTLCSNGKMAVKRLFVLNDNLFNGNDKKAENC